MYSKKFKNYNQREFINLFLKDDDKKVKALIKCSNLIEINKFGDLFEIEDILIHSTTKYNWLYKNKFFNVQRVLVNPNFDIKWFNLYDNDYIENDSLMFRILSNHRNFTKEWFLSYPDRNWNYKILMKKKEFDLECFKLIKDKIVLEKEVYENPNFDESWLEFELPWDIDKTVFSDNFQIEFLRGKQLYGLEFRTLMYHKNFKIEWLEFIREPDFRMLSLNPSLNESWLKKYPNAIWDSSALKLNKNYSCQWIVDYPNIRWLGRFHHWRYCKKMRKNSDFKIEMFINNPYLEWNYSEICNSIYFHISWLYYLDKNEINFITIIKNPNFRIEWVINYPELNWCFNTLSYSPEFDIKLLKMFPHKEWSYRNIVGNQNFKIEWLEECPKLKKYIIILDPSRNSFKLEWLDKYPELNWNLGNISKNKELTFQKYMELKNKIVWNNFDLMINKTFIQTFSLYNLRRFFKIIKIQKWWLDIYYSPRTEVGKRRFKRKFDELFN